MGTTFLNYVTNGCDSLLTGVAPTIDVIGLRMLLGLSTIVLVWFGIQEALGAAQGGQGFHMGRFLNFVMLLSVAYAFVTYYDSNIPGFGYSLTGFIKQGTADLASTIGTDAVTSMLTNIGLSLAKQGPGMVSLTAPYLTMVYLFTQILLAVLGALVVAIVAYGAIAATIVGLLGPLFIPWIVFEKTEWLFWGWLKAYLGFSFYKVVAAAAMSVLGQFFMGYFQQLSNTDDLKSTTQNFPILILLIVVNVFILLKIPAITASIFSGSTSGHDGAAGLISRVL